MKPLTTLGLRNRSECTISSRSYTNESLSSIPATNGKTAAHSFESGVNAFFRESGVGWQLDHGIVEARGENAFEASVREAVSALAESGRTTASGHICFDSNACLAVRRYRPDSPPRGRGSRPSPGLAPLAGVRRTRSTREIFSLEPGPAIFEPLGPVCFRGALGRSSALGCADFDRNAEVGCFRIDRLFVRIGGD